jgi:TRAP-type uncharacterized transport system substrate-binding protein
MSGEAEMLFVRRLFSDAPVMKMTALMACAALACVAGQSLCSNSARAQATAAEMVRKINMSTVGIAAGRTEGAPLRFAAELARVLDDGNDMRLLPIVTRGPLENVTDLLFLRGVDLAIVNGDVLDYYKKHQPVPNFADHIDFITHLFPSELHIFVRPEINRLEDLAGKPVNFNTAGTAAAYSGPIILERLGIKVDARFDPHPIAMSEMARSNKYAATVWVSAKPLDPFLKRPWPNGFKFLPVPLTSALEEYYLPAHLDAADYPLLIPAGQSVQTISVPAVLAVYAWQKSSDRYRRVTRFVDYLVERLPKLQSAAGFHPRWKEINLAANVPGWRRFPAMQQKLDELVRPKGDTGPARNITPAVSLPASHPAPHSAPPISTDGPTEAQARDLLKLAGVSNIASLHRDGRRFWVGLGSKGPDRVRVAVDRKGVIYSRKIIGKR